MQNYFKSGSWNAACDVCKFRFKIEDLQLRWDGFLVCDKDFEFDHPQKYLRVRETGIGVTPIRREGDISYDYICYIYAATGFSGIAEAGCGRVGITTPTYAKAVALKSGMA